MLSLLEAITGAAELVEELEFRLRDPERDAGLEVLARELLAFRELGRVVTAAAHAAEAVLAAAMPKREVALEGIGLLTRGDSGRRVFPEPDRVAGLVRGRALMEWALDKTTGELRDITPELKEAAEAVTAALLRAARLEFRVNGLKDLGVDVEAVSERERGRPTVAVRGAS